MILALIAALLLGVLSGTITGLAPGVHINLVAAILISKISASNSSLLLPSAIFIVSMSITHTFLDFIPSIYLGAPEEDTFLSILPGHQLLKEGKGHEAVIYTLKGSLTAIPIILFVTPLFLLFLPSLFNTIKALIPFILIFISLFIILREQDFSLALAIFLLAGFLGFAVLNLPLKDPLLPLLTGLFGTSALIVSLKDKKQIIKQSIPELKQIKLDKKDYLKSSLAAIISAPLCSIFPGISSGHAATLGSEIIPQSRQGFLFLNGAINTIIMALSYVTLYSIGKARSGTAVAVKVLLPKISQTQLLIILAAIILSAILSFILAVNISKLFAKSINKINYKLLSIMIIIFLFAITFYFTGLLGLFILTVSTSLGIFAILSGSKRINLMGSLLIPTILFYLF